MSPDSRNPSTTAKGRQAAGRSRSGGDGGHSGHDEGGAFRWCGHCGQSSPARALAPHLPFVGWRCPGPGSQIVRLPLRGRRSDNGDFLGHDRCRRYRAGTGVRYGEVRGIRAIREGCGSIVGTSANRWSRECRHSVEPHLAGRHRRGQSHTDRGTGVWSRRCTAGSRHRT